MENIHCNSDICKMKNVAELEHIEHLITGGTDTTKILEKYPQYSREDIEKIVVRVARFCWYGDDE